MKINLPVVLLALLGFIYNSAFGDTTASKGLKFALLGDSMTWIGGDSCQNDTGWSYYLRESGQADLVNVYARSGATWTNTVNTKKDISFYSELLHDDNVIFNQTLRMIADHNGGDKQKPDYIIIFAGANDAWFASKRPGIYSESDITKLNTYSELTDPATVTSLYGSVALTCDLLQKYFPEANLIVVTPLQMSKVSADTVHMTSNIIEKAAMSRGCNVFRADTEVEITYETESKSPTYTYDGVHTNPIGAKLVGEYILNKLSLLYQL